MKLFCLIDAGKNCLPFQYAFCCVQKKLMISDVCVTKCLLLVFITCFENIGKNDECIWNQPKSYESVKPQMLRL